MLRWLHLGAISPFGPIFGKELRSTARRRRTYVLRVVYLLVLMLFLLFAYSTAHFSYGGGGSVAQQAQQQAQLGFIFFVVFSMFSVLAMIIIGPVLTATTIGAERLHKTLHVLLMTPINAWQIVAGKLFSRLWIALTLLGLSLPVVAVVRLLGGVELEQMFAVICLSAVTALFTAAVGLFFSTLINRAYAVILLSYAVLFVLYLFVPFLLGMFFGHGGYAVENWIAPINPAFTTMATLNSGWFNQIDWTDCVLVHLGLTAGLLLTSGLLLRGETRREGSPAVAAAPVGGVLPLSAGAGRLSRPVANNPVLWRETRRPLFARKWQRIVAAIACIGLLLLTYAAIGGRELGDPEPQIGFVIVFHALFLLLTCILAATAIAQEKEGDTWTVLLASPVSGRRIVIGKLLGLLRRLFWPAALMILHFLIFTLTGVLHPVAFLLALWLILAFNSIWIATGLYLSLRLSKTTFAVVLNLLIPLTIYLFAIIAAAIIDETLMRSVWGSYSDRAKELVAFYTPYAYMEGISEWSKPRYWRQSGSLWVPVVGYTDKGTHLAVALAVGAAYLAAAAGIIAWIISRFDGIVGRAPQRR